MNKSEQPTSSTNASIDASSRGIVLVVVESCIFLALDLTALVGNTLVCVALYKNISLRTITNNFILSLALTDLSMAVLAMPFYNFRFNCGWVDYGIFWIGDIRILRFCIGRNLYIDSDASSNQQIFPSC